MSQAIEKYLDRVMIYANRDDAEAPRIRAELRDHLLAKTEELKEAGVAPEDAVFQAIEDHGDPRKIGYSLRSKWPLLDVRLSGTARGVIAVGPKAVGIFAFGGVAIGVLPVGGLAIGLFPMGGFVLALLFGWGGVAVAPVGMAYGGVAMGLVAMGGMACGIVAAGGAAAGLFAGGDSAGLIAGGDSYVSVYTVQTAPEWLLWLANLIPHSATMAIATFAIMAVFFPLLFAGMYLQWREAARIKRLDPRLAE